MNQKYFLGLPSVSLNCISGGLFVFIVCLGIRVAKAPEIGLQIANTQLVVGSSADKLTEVAQKLEAQSAELLLDLGMRQQQGKWVKG